MIRIGIGYDVHPLASGISCMIGGVEIPYDKGPKGHSDGDVLLHAIADALLGAAGEGDIGRHFSPGDPRWKGIASIKLLENVASLLLKKGYQVVNCDCVLIAEAPKILPYVDEMRKRISEALSVEPEAINVKGTTSEKMGFVGRGEGIAAQAVCLLQKSSVKEYVSDD